MANRSPGAMEGATHDDSTSPLEDKVDEDTTELVGDSPGVRKVRFGVFRTIWREKVR
jgi:hypothetical protein